MKSRLLTYLVGGGLVWAAACAQSPQGGDTGTGTGTGGSTGSGAGGSTGGGGSTGAAGSTTGAGGSASGAGGMSTTGTGGVATTGTGGVATTGTGGTMVQMCAKQTPPAASGGANFPFPQHRLLAACSYPIYCKDADVQAAWTKWKARAVVADGGNLRVQRWENGNDTVSEGIGYGMVAAVYMNDKATLDKLWAYAQQHFDNNGLMQWHLNSSGSVVESGSATDGDEDMAFALVMADKQWGGYATPAKALLTNIMNHEVDGSGIIKSGDGFQEDKRNPSYLAPAYYRVFAEYTGNTRWTAVVDASYTLLNKCANSSTGLVPAWCNSNGGALDPSTYQYDACRTPFRIALDACWNNEPRAKAYLAKISAFFATRGAAGITDGFNVNGTPTGTSNQAMAFLGPAGTAAMSANTEPLLDQLYVRVTQLSNPSDPNANYYTYYNASWGILSALVMTGNFVNFLHP
jgi:endo-1,4-beta-D-glucanase Y